jgi:hypothetical protein
MWGERRVGCLVGDRGEPSKAVLASVAVVGALDPDHDRQPQLLAGRPPTPVQDVVLQQAEQGLHCRVVGAGPDASHRAVQASAAEGTEVGVGAELAAAVQVHHRPRGVSQRDGVGERVDGEAGGHGAGHGGADDPVGAGVLDRAQLQLGVGGRVLGDVGQPQPVRCWGGASPGDEVVVDGWPGLRWRPGLRAWRLTGAVGCTAG